MVTDNKELYKYSEKKIKEINPSLWMEIEKNEFEISFKEKFYLYENNIKEVPTCECGEKVKFIDMKSGFRDFCSRKCMYNSSKLKEKRKSTNLEKWGVDNPSKSKEIKEKVIETNKKKFGTEWATQNDSIKEKTRKTNLEKWGVDNPMKLPEIREKVESTMLEKWGVKHAMHSDEIKSKLKEYFIEEFGVDNPMKLPEIKEKAESTMLKRWGVKHALQNDEFINKLKLTNLERWGYEFPIQNSEIKEKIKKTNLEKWGVDNPSKSDKVKNKIRETILNKFGTLNLNSIDEISEKIKKTNLDKFGEDHISKSEKYRVDNYNISKDLNYLKYTKDGYSLFKCGCYQEHNFEIHIDNYIRRRESNLPICTKCYPIDDLKSIKEKEFIKFIKENYDGKLIESYRDGLEIDIYLPDLNLGFEFNGLYWHSDKFKDKWYHLNKTKYFKEKGIRIIHIWEDDWDFKNEIVKSQILNLLEKSEKIFARKCEVKEITDISVIRKFLNENHIQGFFGSKIKLGLFFNSELVSLMTFDKNEGRKKMNSCEWNLSRFCTKNNHTVIGGASKLLRYFIENYSPKRIISYADRDWSVGDLYYKLGFKKLSESDPDYKYVIKGKRFHKSNFRSDSISESDKTDKFDKIWDCGKIKFELVI
jgi:hypothetical protein